MRAGDRYELVRVLKRGGMGEVYEGVMRGEGGFELRVAVKRLLPEIAGEEELVSGFVDEARIVSRLSHANIVRILDFGLLDGVPFQAQELIDGLDLADLVRTADERGVGVPAAIALHIATEIAHALAYVHSAADASGKKMGVVHRDVSLGNILISWAGDVKLADFGIAYAIERLAVTRAGFAKGKREYMAPEQLEGREIDARTDIYALGCVLERLLAGSEPAEDLARIIRRAKWPSKDGRYPNAQAMAADCGRALAARIKTDARTMICEWLEKLRARAEVKQADELFNLELILGSAPGGVRRFDSVAQVPETRVTEVEEPETRVTEPEIDEEALDPTPIAAPPMKTVVLEPAVLPVRRGMDRTHMIAVGALIAVVFFVAVTVTVVRTLNQPDLVITEVPAPVAPKARALPEPAPPAVRSEPDPELQREPERVRKAAPAKPPAAELDAKLFVELGKRGLLLEDVEMILREELDAYRRSKTPATLEQLARGVRAARIDRPLLDAKLARIERRLKDAATTLAPEEIAALDSSFIDLRVALSRASAEPAFAALATRMTDLERRLGKTR